MRTNRDKEEWLIKPAVEAIPPDGPPPPETPASKDITIRWLRGVVADLQSERMILQGRNQALSRRVDWLEASLAHPLVRPWKRLRWWAERLAAFLRGLSGGAQ